VVRVSLILFKEGCTRKPALITKGTMIIGIKAKGPEIRYITAIKSKMKGKSMTRAREAEVKKSFTKSKSLMVFASPPTDALSREVYDPRTAP
jgi:hypothetical protein